MTIFAKIVQLSPFSIIVLHLGHSVEYSVKPEIVITHHLRNVAGPNKELFYSFREW